MSGTPGRKPKYEGTVAAIAIVFLRGAVNWLEGENELFKRMSKDSKLKYAKGVALRKQSELRALAGGYKFDGDVLTLIEYGRIRALTADARITPSGVRERLAWAASLPARPYTADLPSPKGLGAEELAAWGSTNFPLGDKDAYPLPVVDLVNNQYVMSDANGCWCCDTTIREGSHITIVIDIASRCIVGSLFELSPPTAGSMVAFLSKVFRDLGYKPVMFHADQGSAFMSMDFENYLRNEGIQRSTDVRHSQAFGNQVSEGFNFQMWEFLGLNRGNTQKLKEFALQNAADRMFLVNSTITWLNEKRARPGKEHTPRELYTALNEVGKNLRIMTTRDTVEAEFVSDWHDIAVGLRSSRESLEALKSINKEAYLKLNAIYQDCTNHGFNNMGQLGDFKEALTNILQLCYSSIRQTHDKIDQMTAQQEKALELAKSNHDKQMAQIESLTEANQKADDRLEALLELCEERERKEAEKADSIAAARAKRKAAKRAPRRETLSRADMVALLASCTGSSAFFRGRDRVALLILFFFGIRVGNILSISKQQLMSLYKGFPIEVSLVKDKGSAPFRLAPSKTVVAWFHSYKKDFDAVFQNTDLAPKENFYGVTRETITKRLNRYFLNYSNKVNKYLRTHSCRVTLATRVIAGPGIMAAKKLLGHRSIAATLVYDRNQMTAVEQQACYEAVAFEAPSLAKGAGRPRKNPEARSLQEVLTSPATKASPRSAPALGPKAVGKGVAPSIKGGFAGVGGNNSLEREPSLSSPLGKKSNKTLVLHAPLNPRGNFKRLAARRAPARTAASLMGTSVVKGAASSVTLKAPPVVQQPQVKKKNGVLAGKLASTSVAVSAGALAPSGTAGGGGANKKAGVNKKAGEDVRVSKGGALSGGALASSRVPSAAGVF